MAILTPGSRAAFHIWVLMEDAYGGLLGVFNETPSFPKSNHVLLEPKSNLETQKTKVKNKSNRTENQWSPRGRA